MYQATKEERKILIDVFDYKPIMIDLMDTQSEKVRRGESISTLNATSVFNYQSVLQGIRKSERKWWQFWKK